jgi:hypothetical protein
MPSLRVLLVRIFPQLKGTTNHSAAKAYYASNHNNINRANSKRLRSSSQLGNDGINFSKSFTVKYGNQREDDETSLVPMENLDPVKIQSTTRINEP